MSKRNTKINRNTGRKILTLLTVFLLLLDSFLPAYSQNADCIKTQINPLPQKPVEVPLTFGNTNNDSTFENIDPFTDLDLTGTKDQSVLSTCINKNNAARILEINKDGSLSLSNSLAITDPVTSGNPASIRGICTFNNSANQLFFPGNGPNEFGFDRIYPYNITNLNPPALERTKDNDTNNFFIPSDLATSIAVTPNEKFLVYLQGNTSNNNLASLQSVQIKPNKALSQSFIGQDLANIVSAGTYLEFANGPQSKKSKFVLGTFSNLQQGKSGSGDSFGIFKTNQENGINIILAEFKKNSTDFPLPELFNNSNFGGFSGFKIFEKNKDVYLFVSYFETDSNLFPNFKYITKLALFKINISNDSANKASLIQIGTPTTTVFKTAPCNLNNLHGISGPIVVIDNVVYVADNNSNQSISKNENYFAAYFINWDLVPKVTPTTQILKLASIPIRTSKIPNERNTDLVVTSNNKFAYIATARSSEPAGSKIIGYSLQQSNIKCSSLKDDLSKNDICDLTTFTAGNLTLDNIKIKENVTAPLPPAVFPQIPTQGQPNIFINSPPSESNIPSGRPLESFPQSGRPPEFGTPGRPLESGSSPQLNTPSGLQQGQTQARKATPKAPQLSLPDLPSVQLIPSDTTLIASSVTQDINIKALNLTGPDQIIISPKVPYVTLGSGPVELPEFILASSSGSLTTTTSSSSSGSTPVKSSSSSLSSSGGGKISQKDGNQPTDADLESTLEETAISNCCSCEGGKLKCIENSIPTCDNGIINCAGTNNKAISCCSGKPPNQVCKKDDPTITCFAPLTKSIVQKEFIGEKLPTKSSETRGAIKSGSGGHIINLNKDIKQKDLKNILISFIDNKKNIIIIPSTLYLIKKNQLLAKLLFPDSISNGIGTLVTLLNKGGGKKEVLAKGGIKILDSLNFENIGEETKSINALPIVTKIQGRITHDSEKGGKIIRLIFTGSNFATRKIKIKDQLFIAEPFKAHTYLSFGDERDIEVLRIRVLEKGNKMLVTIRFKGGDLSSVPFTISTPKGQFFSEKLEVELFSKHPVRSVILQLDKEKDKKEE